MAFLEGLFDYWLMKLCSVWKPKKLNWKPAYLHCTNDISGQTDSHDCIKSNKWIQGNFLIYFIYLFSRNLLILIWKSNLFLKGYQKTCSKTTVTNSIIINAQGVLTVGKAHRVTCIWKTPGYHDLGAGLRECNPQSE